MALKGLKGIQRKKIKKVVVLTEAQKLANNERMAKLREARKLKNGNAPPKHIHPSVVAKPSSDPLNMDNVREWIAHSKDLLTFSYLSLFFCGLKESSFLINLSEPLPLFFIL